MISVIKTLKCRLLNTFPTFLICLKVYVDFSAVKSLNLLSFDINIGAVMCKIAKLRKERLMGVWGSAISDGTRKTLLAILWRSHTRLYKMRFSLKDLQNTTLLTSNYTYKILLNECSKLNIYKRWCVCVWRKDWEVGVTWLIKKKERDKKKNPPTRIPKEFSKPLLWKFY